MGSPMTLSHLTLGDLKRSNSRSLRFRGLIFCEGAELGHKLLLNINRKAYMESPMTSSHMTLSDLERWNSRSVRLPSLISSKGARQYVTMKLSLQKIAICHTSCRCHAECQGPWTSCCFSKTLIGITLVNLISPAWCWRFLSEKFASNRPLYSKIQCTVHVKKFSEIIILQLCSISFIIVC